MDIGRDLFALLREEAQERDIPVRQLGIARLREDGSGAYTTEHSKTLTRFAAEALALTPDGRRIEGKTPQLSFEEISLRECAANTIIDKATGEPVGDGFIQQYMRSPIDWQRFRESGTIDVVDFSIFTQVSGQLLINSLLKGFANEEFIFSRTAGTYPTRFTTGEIIPGVTPPRLPITEGQKDPYLVKPGQPYPWTDVAERFIDLPPTELRGVACGITRLAVYGDITGQAPEQVRGIAENLGFEKERRGLRVLIGVDTYYVRPGQRGFSEKRMLDGAAVFFDPYQYESSAVTDDYQFKCTTAINGYSGGLAARSFPFYNDLAANVIGEDFTAIQNCDIAFSKIRDPDTGRPILVGEPKLFACQTQEMRINNVMNAYNIWRLTQQGVNTVGAVMTISPNPVKPMDKALSRLLRLQLIEAGISESYVDYIWWYGNIKEAIKYSENWPISMITLAPNSWAEFSQDIVGAWRVSEMGAWAWHNPRLLIRNNYRNTATPSV